MSSDFSNWISKAELELKRRGDDNSLQKKLLYFEARFFLEFEYLLGAWLWHLAENSEVQGSIFNLGKPLTPGLGLKSNVKVIFSKRRIFRSVKHEKAIKIIEWWNDCKNFQRLLWNSYEINQLQILLLDLVKIKSINQINWFHRKFVVI